MDSTPAGDRSHVRRSKFQRAIDCNTHTHIHTPIRHARAPRRLGLQLHRSVRCWAPRSPQGRARRTTNPRQQQHHTRRPICVNRIQDVIDRQTDRQSVQLLTASFSGQPCQSVATRDLSARLGLLLLAGLYSSISTQTFVVVVVVAQSSSRRYPAGRSVAPSSHRVVPMR